MPRLEEDIDAAVRVFGTANVGLVWGLATMHWPSADVRDSFFATIVNAGLDKALTARPPQDMVGNGTLPDQLSRFPGSPMPVVGNRGATPMPPLREPDKFKTVGPVNPDGTPANGARRVDATLQA